MPSCPSHSITLWLADQTLVGEMREIDSHQQQPLVRQQADECMLDVMYVVALFKHVRLVQSVPPVAVPCLVVLLETGWMQDECTIDSSAVV